MKDHNNSLSSQVDFLERNLKGTIAETSGAPFIENENVVESSIILILNLVKMILIMPED